MSWDKVLADTAIADGVEVEVDGKKFSIGQIRAYVKGEQDKLQAKEQAARDREMQAADLFAKVTAFEQDLIAKAPKVPKNGESYNYDADPILSPLHKQLSEKDGEIKKLHDSIKGLTDQFTQTAAYVLNDKWQRDFEGIKNRPDNITFEAALKHATENKLVDKSGVPDIRKAVKEMADPLVRKAETDEAFKRGVAEGEKKMLLSSIPKPGGRGSVSSNNDGSKAKTFTSLDDAINAAKADPEILAAIQGVDYNALSNA